MTGAFATSGNKADILSGKPPAMSRGISIYRRIFSDRPESSKRLRALTFAASTWAAVALSYVAGSPWPLLASPALAVAHIVSYLMLDRRLPALSVVIASVIITAGVLMRFQLVDALHGGRVPVAYFMLVSSTAACFEARTRGGLYTQLVFSALVMFFASEMAFGNEFGMFLGIYLVFILAFLTFAHMADQSKDAEVARFRGTLSVAGYWTGGAAGLGICTVTAFLLLPWDATQAPQAAQMSVFPINGAEAGVQPGVSPADAVRVMQGQSALGGGLPDDGGTGSPQSGGLAPSGPGSEGVLSAAAGPQAGPDAQASAGGEAVVARVRSAVASYWKGESLDTYIPGDDRKGVWVRTLPQGRRLSNLLRDDEDEQNSQKYLQTFFIDRDLDSPIAGYDPVAWALPLDGRGRPDLSAGTAYQAVSTVPDLSAEGLRADQGEWLSDEYSRLPEGSSDLEALTAAVVQDAESDFDRAAAIASYLHNLEYDATAESQLQPSAPLTEFISGQRPGSSMDFATASVLMARAAGLQSRVATGYLPGKFNPYSGASTVVENGAHAWAEVRFRDAGWVPFDPSTRPDLPVPPEIAKQPPHGLSTLIEHRLGDNMASAASRTPGALQALWRALTESWATGAAAGVVVVMGVASLAWRLMRGRRVAGRDRASAHVYTRFGGTDRTRVLRAFAKAERIVASNGYRRRGRAEAFAAYAGAAPVTDVSRADLTWLAGAASKAAYCRAEVSAEAATDAEERTHRLRLSLRSARLAAA